MRGLAGKAVLQTFQHTLGPDLSSLCRRMDPRVKAALEADTQRDLASEERLATAAGSEQGTVVPSMGRGALIGEASSSGMSCVAWGQGLLQAACLPIRDAGGHSTPCC